MAYISRRYAGWFDGMDDYVDGMNLGSLTSGELTVCAVVRPSDGVSARLDNIIGTSDYWANTVGSWWLYRNNSTTPKFRFGIYDNNLSNKYVNSSTVIEGGKVYVVCGKYDGMNISLYVNGVKENSISASIDSIVYGNLIMSYTSGTRVFNGDIYAVYIWSRALSDSEIAKLNEDPFNPQSIPRDGLVGWWDFNRADWMNGVLPDLSGNGNDGMMHGVAQRTVLVKRGIGNLPKYDLKYGLIVGQSKGDYVEWHDIQLGDVIANQNHSWFRIARILMPASGGLFGFIVKDYANGIGHYDANTGRWRVDVGEVGYFAEKRDIVDGGRYLRYYVDNVKVDDNSQSVPFLRAEIINENTGEIISFHDYYANKWSTTEFKTGWQVGENEYLEMVPVSTYTVRLYSYGNIGFWVGSFVDDMFHNRSVLVYDNTNGLALELRFQNKSKQLKHFYKYRIDKVMTYPQEQQDIGVHIEGKYAYDYIGFDFNNVQYEVWGNDATEKKSSSWVNFDTNVSFKGYDWIKFPDSAIQRENYEFVSLMLYDRLLDVDELLQLQDRNFVLDGLVHWWIVDENGDVVDLVTGVKGTKHGNPILVEIYDSDGRLNSEIGIVLFDIIKDERGGV